MAPKPKQKSPPSDPNGIFSAITVFLVETGIQARRLQIWKQKLVQMGAKIEDSFSKRVTHIFAAELDSLLKKLGAQNLKRFKGKILNYQWIEDSLRAGEKVSEDPYILSSDSVEKHRSKGSDKNLKHTNANFSNEDQLPSKKNKTSPEESKIAESEERDRLSVNSLKYSSKSDNAGGSSHSSGPISPEGTSLSLDCQSGDVSSSDASLLYSPPDMNRNITEIFGKLIDIYRALGDDRRSFSYHKAIPVIEKLPFKIESVDQVKHLPGIGKSLQDHIQEIVNTGKLSKLEHFEKDEKVHSISLFGEVWGIGPTTASKLYEKGHRTLDDLKIDESLTNSQRLGLKYFDDIKTRIPRHEVQEMESLIKKVGEEILPGVDIVCGGSYRRGKASCGDMDFVITHPDGKSHIGFLPKFVKRLKDMNFLREDLIFSVHSEEGTDSGVDTYFGLCAYPGRELRHRIDFKVYPRDIYAFGLVAWTGNDVLNRRLRLLAESKGFRLDDTGLFPATHGSGGKRGSKGSASLKFATEKEVFDFLGFPWLEPNDYCKNVAATMVENRGVLYVFEMLMISSMYVKPFMGSLSISKMLFSMSMNLYGSSSLHSSSSKTPAAAFRSLLLNTRRKSNLICTAEKEYKFPDPIPEFADSETEKFKSHLTKKLSKKEMFGDSLDEVVGICTEIFDTFLHTEYGGPGTLLVLPFIDMADTINEKGLPGGPQAARAAVKWAQAHVDKDWKEWTST
ncbi:DNA polymerase lambda [Perilla frutescens var. frutescens]|nr:DNA polymerase lambda [Perilla frutescens var. frutescens]